ncbi:MAG: hypothetical protein V4662_09770 [Verrucomicrobiota bacterium]
MLPILTTLHMDLPAFLHSFSTRVIATVPLTALSALSTCAQKYSLELEAAAKSGTWPAQHAIKGMTIRRESHPRKQARPSSFWSLWLVLCLFFLPAASPAEIAVEMALGLDPSLVAWARNDQLLISISDLGEVRVWETATGNLLHTLPSSGVPLAKHLVASSDGEWIGTLENGKAIITNRRTRKVAWSSDEVATELTGLTSSSVTLAFADREGYTGRVARLQWPEGKVVAQWQAPSNSICASVHSISQGRTAVCMSGRTTYILDKDLLESARIAPQQPKPFYYSHGTSQASWISLATSSGALLANADEPEKGFQVVESLRGRTYLPSPDGSLWLGGTLGRWAVYDRNGKSIAAADLLGKVFEEGVAWSADSGTLAVPSSNGIQLINARTGKLVRKFGTKHLGDRVVDVRESTALSSAGGMLAIKTPEGDWSIVDCHHPLEWKTASDVASPQPRDSSSIDSFILSTPTGWQRYEYGTVEPLEVQWESSVFDVQCIGDSVWLRSNSEMTVHSFSHGKKAAIQSFPLFIGTGWLASPDAQWVLHQDQDEKKLVLRRAPDWQAVAEFTLPRCLPQALLVSADGGHIGWIDSERHWWSYAVGSAGPENKLTLPSGTYTDGFTHSSAPSLAVSWQILKSPFTGIVVDAEGRMKYQIGSWKHFTDETGLMPVGFGPSQKHLWLCGQGARPILVDLATGQPLLRLHFLAKGVTLWEMASGNYYGPEAAKAYLRWTDLDTTRPLSAAELAAVWREEALANVLKAYMDRK